MLSTLYDLQANEKKKTKAAIFTLALANRLKLVRNRRAKQFYLTFNRPNT
jgi:hypothetical protein